MKKIKSITILLVILSFFGCKNETKDVNTETSRSDNEIKENMKKKEVVYQVFTSLFGNTNTTNKP